MSLNKDLIFNKFEYISFGESKFSIKNFIFWHIFLNESKEVLTNWQTSWVCEIIYSLNKWSPETKSITINFFWSLYFGVSLFIIACPTVSEQYVWNVFNPTLKIFLYPYSTLFFIAYLLTVLIKVFFTNPNISLLTPITLGPKAKFKRAPV